MPIIFGLVLIFVIWFQYQKRKTNKLEKEETEAFLKRETQANLTRKQDISKLEYIVLPTTGLPLTKSTNETQNQFIETYLSYIDKKIINLSHFSNTELKELYGLANLSILSQYDENFFSLAKLLNDWGLYLFESEELLGASQVLELAILIKTEIAQSYLTLAMVYAKQECPEKIASLKTTYSSLTDTPSEKILAQFDKIVFESLVESDSSIEEPLF